MAFWRHPVNIRNASRQLYKAFSLRNPHDDPIVYLPTVTKFLNTGVPPDKVSEKFLHHQSVMESACREAYSEPPKITTIGNPQNTDQYLNLYYKNLANANRLFIGINNNIDFDGTFEKCRVTDLVLFRHIKFSSWIITKESPNLEAQNKSDNNIAFVRIDGEKKLLVITNNTDKSRNLAREQMLKANSYQSGDIIFDLEEYDKVNPTPLLTKLVRFVAESEAK